MRCERRRELREANIPTCVAQARRLAIGAPSQGTAALVRSLFLVFTHLCRRPRQDVKNQQSPFNNSSLLFKMAEPKIQELNVLPEQSQEGTASAEIN